MGSADGGHPRNTMHEACLSPYEAIHGTVEVGLLLLLASDDYPLVVIEPPGNTAMMFVIYWFTLALGGVIATAAVTLFVLGACLERRRRLFLTLGAVAFCLAWMPPVAFFAVQYAAGARPAGWDPGMSQPRAPTAAPLAK